MSQYSQYPGQVDTSTQLPLATDNVTPVKAEVVNRLRDSILAIESELGPNPSSTWSTVRERLDALENTGGSGSGGNIQTALNDTIIESQTTNLNFVGDVTVTAGAPHQAIVTIGKTLNQVQETIVVSNSQTTIVLNKTPVQSNAVIMYVNGIKQNYGIDYNVSSKNVSYISSVALLSTDLVEFWYLISSINVSVNNSEFTNTNVKTATYFALIGDLIRCDPTSGGFTINLPTAIGNSNSSIIVKNIANSVNAIVIRGSGSETIDGSLTQTITVAYQSLTLRSTGLDWIII